MTDDFRHREVEVYINRWAQGKIPRDAPQDAWRKFHSSWQREKLTARQLAVEVYEGHSFAPVFDGRKTKDHFVVAWHVALDFDCANRKAKIETLLAHDFINDFSSFLYYTPSSQPPFYRTRVVFILDEPITTVDEYEELLQALAWKFPDSDQSTTDAARFFYGSKDCELHGNWSILGRGAWSWIIAQWKEANPPQASRPLPTFSPRNVKEDEIVSALDHIPPQMDYHEWLSVLMGVHSVFPGSRGVQLCEEWSPGYPGEIEDKFKSFKRTGSGRTTVRTLFKMAQDHGWENPGNGNGSHYNGSGGTYTRRGANDLRAAI